MSSQPNKPPPPNNPPPGHIFTDEELEAMPPLRCNDLTPAVIENIVGRPPVNMIHYDIALSHPSAGAEFDYEQYEFLGDAVLNFVTAKFLFEHHAERGEGFMTVMRSKLTRCEHLAKLANALALPHFVKMDATSIFTKQNFSKKVEEDLFEAFVAAVYLDLGLLAAKKFILDVYEKHVDWADLSKNRNYKETFDAAAARRPRRLAGVLIDSRRGDTHIYDDSNDSRSVCDWNGTQQKKVRASSGAGVARSAWCRNRLITEVFCTCTDLGFQRDESQS